MWEAPSCEGLCSVGPGSSLCAKHTGTLGRLGHCQGLAVPPGGPCLCQQPRWHDGLSETVTEPMRESHLLPMFHPSSAQVVTGSPDHSPAHCYGALCWKALGQNPPAATGPAEAAAHGEPGSCSQGTGRRPHWGRLATASYGEKAVPGRTENTTPKCKVPPRPPFLFPVRQQQSRPALTARAAWRGRDLACLKTEVPRRAQVSR